MYSKVPRIPGGLLTDDGVLAQSVSDSGLVAERARSGAVSHLAAMNVDQGLKRAILSKTGDDEVVANEGLGPQAASWRWPWDRFAKQWDGEAGAPMRPTFSASNTLPWTSRRASSRTNAGHLPPPDDNMRDLGEELVNLPSEAGPISQAPGLSTPVPHVHAVALRTPLPLYFGDPLRSVNAAARTPHAPRHTRSRSPAPPTCQLPQPSDLILGGASFDDNLLTKRPQTRSLTNNNHTRFLIYLAAPYLK